MAQFEALPHAAGAQIQEAVFEAQGLVGRIFTVDHEGEGGAGVEYDHGVIRQQFHAAGGHFGVHHGFGALTHGAGNGDAVFHFEIGGQGLDFLRGFFVHHHLCDSVTVAQVDEVQSAVVSAAVNPAVEGNGSADKVGIQLAAGGGTLVLVHSFKEYNMRGRGRQGGVCSG